MFVRFAGVQILHILLHDEHLQQRGQGAGDAAHPPPPPLSQLVHQVRGAPDIEPVLYQVQVHILNLLSSYTVKKRLSFFPSPVGMSLTKSPWPGMIKLFPARETGKTITILQCM